MNKYTIKKVFADQAEPTKVIEALEEERLVKMILEQVEKFMKDDNMLGIYIGKQ
jgi:hypothetical protein